MSHWVEDGATHSPAVPAKNGPLEHQSNLGSVEVAASTSAANTPAQNTPAQNAPAQVYLVPFDRHPIAAPGEKIIFNSVFSDSDPNAYQLVYTASGGGFGAAGGPQTKTIAGLQSGNLYFFIDKAWTGKAATAVKLEVQKVKDKSVVSTHDWTFAKKAYYPTEVTQVEAETERTLPSNYTYKVGPDRNKDGKDDYVGHTVLERFDANQGNIAVNELKPAYAKANGLTSQDQVTAHFFGNDSGSNGTFTVFPGDKYADQHGGGMPDKSTFESALIKMKEVHVDLPQYYEAEPGKTLGKYTIRRILKPDGAKKLSKFKTK